MQVKFLAHSRYLVSISTHKNRLSSSVISANGCLKPSHSECGQQSLGACKECRISRPSPVSPNQNLILSKIPSVLLPCPDEHRMLCGSAVSLYGTPETDTILYVKNLRIKKEKFRTTLSRFHSFQLFSHFWELSEDVLFVI